MRGKALRHRNVHAANASCTATPQTSRKPCLRPDPSFESQTTSAAPPKSRREAHVAVRNVCVLLHEIHNTSPSFESQTTSAAPPKPTTRSTRDRDKPPPPTARDTQHEARR